MIDFNKCFCGEIIGDRATYCTYCRLKKSNDANRARRMEETWWGVEEMYESWDKDLCVLTDLMNIIQKAHHVSLYRMRSKDRHSEVAIARFHYYYFVDYLRQKISWFNPTNLFVGQSLGQDHAMYYHGVKTITRDCENDKVFKETTEKLLKQVNEILINQKNYLKMEIQKLNNTLSAMPLSKSDIHSLVRQTLDAIEDAGGAINFAVLVAAMDEYITTLKKSPEWRDLVLNEIGDETTHRGATIKRGEYGTKYDYSVCGSSKWEELDSLIKTKTIQKKSLEERFRLISKGATIIDEETGEVYSPPVKRSTTSYSVSLKG